MKKILLTAVILGVLSSSVNAKVSEECKEYAKAFAHYKMNSPFNDKLKYKEVKRLGNVPKKCWYAGEGITGNESGGLNFKYSVQENVDRDVINSIYNLARQMILIKQNTK